MPNRFPYKREYQFPYGAGSVEFKNRYGDKGSDVPTEEHSFRGHTLTPSTTEPYHWTIKAEGFQTHPSLEGQFTDVASCERAINAYWSSREDGGQR
jgi:hypothetical protein